MTSSLMARLNATSSVPDPVPYKPPAPRPPSEPKKPEAAPESKSLIQLLLQNSSSPNSYRAPPPFFMCSQVEALDRQSCLELSPFECVQPHLQIVSPTPQKSRGADATWDANEIQLDSPTPKKSSLAAAAISTPIKSSYYSKQSSKPAYVPPFKRNNNDATTIATPPKPAAAISIETSSTSTPLPPTSTAKKAARTRPFFHPQLVIKKYRRSAAGGGVNEDTESVRTLDQLNSTVDYLMSVLERQGPPNMENESNCGDAWGADEQISTQEARIPVQFSLCDTVNFIDDRLRAVQKDLVSLVGDLEDSSCNTNSLDNVQTKRLLRQMQAKMARYNILTLYLLSNVPPSKYQVKFGTRALRTCFTCYLNLSQSLHEDYTNEAGLDSLYWKELRTQDEIMAYVAILHMSSVLRSEETALPPASTSEISSSLMEESGSGWGSLFTTFLKYAWERSKDVPNCLVDKYPRWKWALELAASVQSGNYQCYFTLLERGPTYNPKDLAPNTSNNTASENARFLILAKCCASHSLNLVRLSALRRYNHAFGKGEKVPIQNIARLLRFQPSSSSDAEDAFSSERTIEFCRDVGLPIIDDDPTKCFVVMKSAPIEISGDESIGRIGNPSRSSDMFVFGTEFTMQTDALSSLTSQLGRVNMNESIDDWEERDSNNCSQDMTSCDDIPIGRLDDDLILIPPSAILSKLVE